MQDGPEPFDVHVREITGEAPTLVLSDDVGSGKRIEEFAASDSRWMVAVRMVSEGVDIPRLRVGVYASAAKTPSPTVPRQSPRSDSSRHQPASGHSESSTAL